jgi:hypothetical protein
MSSRLSRRIGAAFSLTSLASLALASPALAETAAKPAGGAATGEIALATAGASVMTTVLLLLCAGHRSGRISLLSRAAAGAERVTGLPGWTALPSALATVSLLTALFGMYWDISLHIDVGRDTGPLTNPAHYLILGGLFGIFSAGCIAVFLPREPIGGSALRITRDWHAPLGGILICVAGAFALSGFPLDDGWHRLFGQDVTLWGPTHLMLIGGAVMTLIGIAVLQVEGGRAKGISPAGDERLGWLMNLRRYSMAGGLLIGLSTFQGEFDFGVPQFRLVFGPVLIMFAAAVALVAMRLWLGRGAALGAVAFFLVIRGAITLVVGPVLGESTAHFPLYIAEALCVEAVALLVPRERPLRFAMVSGAAIGTVGLAAEWAWSHVWSPVPWPASMFPEGALLGFAVAVGGALVGGWIGARLSAETLPRTPSLRAAAVAGATVLAAVAGYCLYTVPEQGIRADVTLADTESSGGNRMVNATVRLDPPTAADDAEWLTATAWQGGGLVVDHLRQMGPGVYRTTRPIPVHGDWKALIRLHDGRSLTAVPVYLPEDPAIPAPKVAAASSFDRTFTSDRRILQREAKDGTSPALTVVAYSAVLGLALAILAALAFGLHRLAVTTGPEPRPAQPARRLRRPHWRTRAA